MTLSPLATQQRDEVLTNDASGGKAGAAGEYLLSGDNENLKGSRLSNEPAVQEPFRAYMP